MTRTRASPCSTCAYWEPYPGWKGVGTCDQTMSDRFGHMAVGSAENCDQYVATSASPSGRVNLWGQPPSERTCLECQYWLPFESMPRVGQCDNPESRHYKSPEFADKPVEGCFATRSLNGLEFMWCQTHRQTIYADELPDHMECLVFVSSVSLPVEDEMELTLAGD